MTHAQPTEGRIARKITCRADARAVAESLLPLPESLLPLPREHHEFFVLAARKILTEVIVSLHVKFPGIWSLRTLALIVSHPWALCLVLQKTPEGRELFLRYFRPDCREVTRTILATLISSLY